MSHPEFPGTSNTGSSDMTDSEEAKLLHTVKMRITQKAKQRSFYETQRLAVEIV